MFSPAEYLGLEGLEVEGVHRQAEWSIERSNVDLKQAPSENIVLVSNILFFSQNKYPHRAHTNDIPRVGEIL